MIYPAKSHRGQSLRNVLRDHVNHYAGLWAKSTPAGSNGWAKRHADALRLHTSGNGIPGILHALAEYADSHSRRFESLLGEDYILGPAWLSALTGIRTLLNGDIGQLDGGATDGLLFDLARAAGFSKFDGETLEVNS